MSNPARKLRLIFNKWAEFADKSPYDARKFRAANTAAFKDHEDAIRAIADISRALDVLERDNHKVDHYRRSMKLFITTLINVPNSWTSGMQRETLTSHMFDMLEALEGFLDSNTTSLTDHGRANLEDLLSDVLETLAADEELTELLRTHLVRVVQQIRDCIEEFGLTGQTDLKQALYDLWISLYAAAGSTTGESSAKWKSFAEKIGYPTVSSVLGSIPGVAVSVLQLTQG